MTTANPTTRIDLDVLTAPFISAEISAALASAGLNSSLVGIDLDATWGPTIRLSSSHCGRRRFVKAFEYYVQDDTWANGCGNIDHDQEAAIAIVRSLIRAHTQEEQQ